MKLRRLFRRVPPSREIVISGYATGVEPDNPTPTWEPDQVFESVDAATATARSWIAETGRQAEVNVIEVAGNQSRVVRVVTADGIEDISYP